MDFLESLIYTQLFFVSNIGNTLYFGGLAVGFIFLYLLYKGYIKESLLLILVLLSFLYSVVLKFLFQTDRPLTADYNNNLFGYYSFPSSHAFVYTTLLGYLVYLSFKLRKMDKLLRFIIRYMSLYFLLLVGISRVYLGAHYISDVIGGYIFGAIYLLFVLFLDLKLVDAVTKNKRKDNKRTDSVN